MAQFELQRPLAVFDIESTGVSPGSDRIVELCITRIMPGGDRETHTWRVNPGIPIPAEASAVHGITDADVADCPAFADIAERVHQILEDCDLGGFNVVRFDIPMLTEEFLRAGVRFDWLSPQLLVPVDWVGANTFRDAVAGAYRKTLDAYNRPEPPDMAEKIDAKIQAGQVDFGDLDEPMQRTVIETVCRDPEKRQQVLDANPHLPEAFAVRLDTASNVIRQNAESIRQHFSLEPSGQRLLNIYTQVAASGRDEPPQPLSGTDKVLDQFLRPDRFRLIRS